MSDRSRGLRTSRRSSRSTQKKPIDSSASSARSAANSRRSRGVEAVVRAALAELKRLGRPERAKGAAAYFKAYETLTFFGVDSPTVRRMASRIKKEHAREWTLRDAVAFADAMLARSELEAKGLGQCVLGKFRRQFTPSLLPRTKRWFTKRCTDWASTDGLCGEVLSPLLVAHPALVPELPAWRSSPHLVCTARLRGGTPSARTQRAGSSRCPCAALDLGGRASPPLEKAPGGLLAQAGHQGYGEGPPLSGEKWRKP